MAKFLRSILKINSSRNQHLKEAKLIYDFVEKLIVLELWRKNEIFYLKEEKLENAFSLNYF